MRSLGLEFRRQVTGAFARHVGLDNVTCISSPQNTVYQNVERRDTENAMQSGVKMIVGAILADDRSRVFARVPFLLRADVGEELFNLQLQTQNGISLDQVYIAVGIKRRTITTHGPTNNLRFKCIIKAKNEMFLWNMLLSRIQNYDPAKFLVVGLHPRKEKAVAMGAILSTNPAESSIATATVFDRTVWKYAVVELKDANKKQIDLVFNALEWRMDVEDKGNSWLEAAVKHSNVPTLPDTCATDRSQQVNPMFALLSSTSDSRLRPNMKSPLIFDWPWSTAKKRLAHELGELTLVSGVSKATAEWAMANGIPNDFTHKQVTAETLGLSSLFTSQTILKNKSEYNGPAVTPAMIPHNRSNWRRLQNFLQHKQDQFSPGECTLPDVESRSFYVDFELAAPDEIHANDCAPDGVDVDEEEVTKYDSFFDVYPRKPIQEFVSSDSLIIMIGCGQLIDGKWSFELFVADKLDEKSEGNVIIAWLEHMRAVMAEGDKTAIVHVWGPEKHLLRKALRHMNRNKADEVRRICKFELLDMLKIVTSSCLSIKGSLSNSLKSIISALGRLDLVDVAEKLQVENGADAMAALLASAEYAHSNGLKSFSQVPLMKNVARYNEQDCRDVARIAEYLREFH